MKVQRIELAWISVSQIKNAERFFKDILGLQVISQASEYGWMEMQGEKGGMYLGVGQAQHGERAGHNAVVTFVVEDIASMKKQMEQKNVRFEGDIMEVPGHIKLATFYDEDGNQFQLAEHITELAE